MKNQILNNVDAATATRSGNTILELISMACMNEIESSEEGKALHNALYKYMERAQKKLGFEAIRELEDSGNDLRHHYAEEMFKWGWNLRGNPELLAQLIEPE